MAGSAGSGTTWVVSHLPSGTSLPVSSIACADALHCLVIARSKSGGALLTTDDGGATWTTDTSPYSPADLADVSCARGTTDCFAVGTVGTSAVVEHTSNLGGSWSRQTLPSAMLEAFGVSCVRAFQCVAVGMLNDPTKFIEGAVALTTNAGATWKVVDPGTFALSAISCSTVSFCVAAGGADGDGYIARTTDGGASWSQGIQSSPDYFQSVSCPTYSECLVTGADLVGAGHDDNLVEITRDGGADWKAETVAEAPEAVSCPDSNHCWMTAQTSSTGAGGTSTSQLVYASIDGGTSFSPETPSVGAYGAIDCPTDNVCFSPGALGRNHAGVLITTRNAEGLGCTGSLGGPASIVAPDPDGGGYWLASNDGGVSACGTATFYGSPASEHRPPTSSVVGIGVASGGHGYYLLERDGTVLNFGPGAHARGSGPAGGAPFVGMAVDDSTGGYWLVNSGGGVFAFGAPFRGSVPGVGKHVSNIVGIATDAAGSGYWIAGTDGGIYSFGLPFHGSLPALKVKVNNIVDVSPAATGQGYYLFGSNGGVYALGSGLHYCGSGVNRTGTRFRAGAVTALDGYWLATTDGALSGFNAPFSGDPSGGAPTLSYC
jgi:photosystem II stability/assembly factor-like uncharacterized protein